MKVDKLFHVLVVAGAASTVGLVACGDDEGGEEEGTGGGGPGTGGASATGGASSTGGDTASTGGDSSSTGGESGDSCDAVCEPSSALASWTDCNGCCCWLPIGQTTTRGSPICGEEPCCEVGDNGR
jgi:hypothetical protein